MRNNQLGHTLFRLIVLAGFGVFLVLLLFSVLLAPRHYVRVRFSLPSESSTSYLSYSRHSLAKQIKNKLLVQFILTGSQEIDDKILENVDLETRRLNITSDTMHVIKVHFSAENTYGQFVRLVNFVHIEMTGEYWLLDDDFYIFGNPKEDTTPTIDSTKTILPIYL